MASTGMKDVHKNCLRECRVYLVQNLTVDGLLDHLNADNIINPEDMQVIKSKTSREEQVRTLLDRLPTKGPNAFDSFVNALQETSQVYIVDKLRGTLKKGTGVPTTEMEGLQISAPGTSSSGTGTRAGASETVGQAIQESSGGGGTRSSGGEEDETDAAAAAAAAAEPMIVVTDKPIKVKVKACNPDFYKQTRVGAYAMNWKPRGKALIVSVQFKDDPELKREGTKVDCENLRQLLDQLHFDVEVCTESDDGKIRLKAKEIEEKVKEFATPENHRESQCCVLVLLTHGTNGGLVYGTDGKTVNIKELINYFKVDGHPLADKPKIIIIQACRGERMHEKDAVPDALPRDHSIICYATEEDFVSYRNPENGSPFITALVKVFEENACDTDILALLNKVKTEVKKIPLKVKKEDDTVVQVWQIPVYKDKLDEKHKLYFFPQIGN